MCLSGKNVWTCFTSKINSSKNPQVYLLLVVQGTTLSWQSKLLLKLWDQHLTRSRSFPSCSVSPAIILGGNFIQMRSRKQLLCSGSGVQHLKIYNLFISTESRVYCYCYLYFRLTKLNYYDINKNQYYDLMVVNLTRFDIGMCNWISNRCL